MTQVARTTKQMGAIIRRERKKRRLTQSQLGQQIGPRQATISKLETGEPATQLKTLFDVLSALRLELNINERSKTSLQDIEKIF